MTTKRNEKTILDAIRAAFANQGWTQGELAKLAGTSYPQFL